MTNLISYEARVNAKFAVAAPMLPQAAGSAQHASRLRFAAAGKAAVESVFSSHREISR
ncbi:elongation factor P--beta-lysine ligase [Rhodococcus sp. 27YEA15]|uniref:hypothetical protein n=1 Tax=Rhodococcus sp. 27YEA15 TaxID=3156259 RepID=UPI003C7C47A9